MPVLSRLTFSRSSFCRHLVALLSLFSLLACSIARAAPPAGFFLEVEAANPAGGWGHLFYDIGQWYSGVDSCRVEIPAGIALRPYRFPIPAKTIKHLRFDPADGAAVVRLGRIRLLTAEGTVLASFGPEKLVPMQSILDLQIHDGIATVTTGPDDPMLSIASPLQSETLHALGREVIGPLQLWPLGLVILLFLGLAIWVAVEASVGSTHRPTATTPLLKNSSHRSWWVLAGAFLAVLGARLYWLKLYSRPMPFWDEWNTDAIALLIPLRGGFLDWEALFIPQGEHRILLTRLITLLGTLCNGEWDPRVGMVASAFFFAGSVALVCAAVVRYASRLNLLAVLCLVAWASLPFDWRNVYWGDQSQMYVLNFLAICTLTIAASENFGPLVWLGGFAAATVSLFTMGSGFIAPGLAAAICLLRWRHEPENRRSLALMGGIFLVVTLVGLSLYRKAPYQGPGYTQTLAQFFLPFVSRASWPLSPHPIAALAVWFPWLVLAVFSLLPRRPSPVALLALGVGAWALLNAAGLAHGRPHDLPPFDTKYYTAMSVTVTGAILSSVALFSFWPARKLWALVAAVASLVTTVALFQRGLAGFHGSRDQLSERLANDNLVRPFLATGDPTQLRATHFSQLPYWNGAELAEILDSPHLQPWLPAVLRASLAQRPHSPLHGPQTPGPLTVASRSLMKTGAFLFFLGCALLLWSVRGRKRNRKDRAPLSTDQKFPAALAATPGTANSRFDSTSSTDSSSLGSV